MDSSCPEAIERVLPNLPGPEKVSFCAAQISIRGKCRFYQNQKNLVISNCIVSMLDRRSCRFAVGLGLSMVGGSNIHNLECYWISWHDWSTRKSCQPSGQVWSVGRVHINLHESQVCHGTLSHSCQQRMANSVRKITGAVSPCRSEVHTCVIFYVQNVWNCVTHTHEIKLIIILSPVNEFFLS